MGTSASLVTGGICFYRGDERFFANVLMPTVHKAVDAEQAHKLALWAFKKRLFQPGKVEKPEHKVKK